MYPGQRTTAPWAAAAAPPAKVSVPHKLHPDGIDIAGWSIRSTKGPILNSADTDTWSDELGMKKLPTMVFGYSKLELKHKGGVVLSLDVRSALQHCFLSVDKGIRPPAVVVAFAEKWSAERPEASSLSVVDEHVDWTFTTTYRGTLSRSDGSEPAQAASTEKLDMELLSRRDPILFFDEIHLFDDELDDNGLASLTVKIRVMPTYWFVLLRYWVRVDEVAYRVYDTRFFHAYESNSILRDTSFRDGSFEDLSKKIPAKKLSKIEDGGEIAQILPERVHLCDRILLS